MRWIFLTVARNLGYIGDDLLERDLWILSTVRCRQAIRVRYL